MISTFSVSSSILVHDFNDDDFAQDGAGAALSMETTQLFEATDTIGIGTIAESNDSRVDEFLSTDWKKDIISDSEMQKLNFSIEKKLQNELSIVPFEPVNSISGDLNISLPPRNSETGGSSVQSMGYFDGHTWASSFGPNDVETRAVPITPVLEGHWFPKESYSRVYYYDYLYSGASMHIRLERGQDTYSRYFRVYVGTWKAVDDTIYYYEDSWEGDVQIPFGWQSGNYVITLEINYGGHVDHGWNLRYLHLFDYFGQPEDNSWEFFRKLSSSEPVYRVPMGPKTKLFIQTVNQYDPYLRYIYIYIDGTYMCRVYAPGSYELNLVDYRFDWSTPSMRELKIVLYYGGYIDYGKAVKQLLMNYEYRHIEVDWMSGYLGSTYYNHQQPSEVFDFVEAYYMVHDYRRIEFHPNESVPIVYGMNSDTFEHDYYEGGWFDHYGVPFWSYGLHIHYLEGPPWGFGFPNKWFVIGDQESNEQSSQLMDARKWILLHEYGHIELMEDNSGGNYDVYGLYQVHNDPWYCAYSWEEEHLPWIRAWW